jgi:hypothetical protein
VVAGVSSLGEGSVGVATFFLPKDKPPKMLQAR